MSTSSNLHFAIIGSADFQRRVNAIASRSDNVSHILTASYSEAWGKTLSSRPNVIAVEVGIHHSSSLQSWTREYLEQARERFGQEIYIIVVITASEHLFFGGDLLLLEDELQPSQLVDTFVVVPPYGFPSAPGLSEQLHNALALSSGEISRRERGEIPLPPLCTQGWVQSLADPRSRELWMRWLPRYAKYTNESPIILGQTGTGKTNLAYALHHLSGRTGKFVSITPRDFSSSELVQAELFGAVAGAYTGAVEKWGLVKSAEKGTLFIDELQSIDKDLQGKLITFIENKAYRRVGSSETIDADVRFVFASNRTLSDMMQTQTLRDDFAYRLERVQLELRPLHMRRLDISAALAFALAKIHRQRPHTNRIIGCNNDAYRMLFGGSWPGNLRQLENTVAQLTEVADMTGKQMIDEMVVTEIFESKLVDHVSTSPEIISKAAFSLANEALVAGLNGIGQGVSTFEDFARSFALEAAQGDTGRAAELIHESSQTLELHAQRVNATRYLGGK